MDEFIATCELRFKIISPFGREGILQQKFYHPLTNEEIWRDVPLVVGNND